jgi:hypothetical protein
MAIKVGDKVTAPMPNGLRWPGVAITNAVPETVNVLNKRTNERVDITVTRYKVITLRETREGEKYLALSSEVEDWGYRPVAEPRFSTIVGLDATEDGEKMGLQALIEAHGISYSEFQRNNFEARRGATAAEDL